MAETMRDLKRRMKSIESTEHITNAMRLVSAAKFRRAKGLYDRKSQQLREVSATIEGILAEENISGREKTGDAEVGAAPARVLAIVISSDKGLCGGFNSSLIKTAKAALEDYEKENVKVFCIGSRGRDFFEHADYEIAGSFDGAPEKIVFPEIEAIAAPILADYRDHKLDKVLLITTEYINSLRQEPMVKQLLPAEPAACAEAEAETTAGVTSPVEIEYAPSREAVAAYMLPKYFELALFKAVIESAVCEHAARRTAMENATDNAREILNSLSLTYNRVRQAAITGELIEIVSGAETQK